MTPPCVLLPIATHATGETDLKNYAITMTGPPWTFDDTLLSTVLNSTSVTAANAQKIQSTTPSNPSHTPSLESLDDREGSVTIFFLLRHLTHVNRFFSSCPLDMRFPCCIHAYALCLYIHIPHACLIPTMCSLVYIVVLLVTYSVASL